LHQPGDDWDTARLTFLSSWVWRAIVELGERMETRQAYTIENLETPDNYYYHDFVLQVIDDDAKMSSFLSFLNQKGGEGKKQTSGQQRVVEWLQEALDPPPGRVWPREATGRNVNLQKDLLQIARLEGDKIDWNRLREIIKKQLQVRRFSPLLLSKLLLMKMTDPQVGVRDVFGSSRAEGDEVVGCTVCGAVRGCSQVRRRRRLAVGGVRRRRQSPYLRAHAGGLPRHGPGGRFRD